MIVSYFVVGDEHRRLAEMSAASVKRVYPHASICIDQPRPSERPMMVANIDSQIRTLHDAHENEEVLFLDTDTLLKRQFPFGSADLYVTWRDTAAPGVEGVAKQMPYNYGVLGCRARPATLEAFYWLRYRVLQMAPTYQAWYGNQLALAELACAPRKEGGVTVRHVRWSYEDTGTPLIVEYLPCETYNYTPQDVGEDVSQKVVVHCKGNRKHMMEAYAA